MSDVQEDYERLCRRHVLLAAALAARDLAQAFSRILEQASLAIGFLDEALKFHEWLWSIEHIYYRPLKSRKRRHVVKRLRNLERIVEQQTEAWQ